MNDNNNEVCLKNNLYKFNKKEKEEMLKYCCILTDIQRKILKDRKVLIRCSYKMHINKLFNK